jgi:hypothetical protein
MRRTAARKHARQNLLTFMMFVALCLAGNAFAQEDVDVVDNAVDIVNDAEDVNVIDAVVDNAEKTSKSEKSKKSDKKSNSEAEENFVAPGGEKLSEKIIKIKGLVAAGVDINRKIGGSGNVTTERNRVGRGELEISVQPVKKVRAEIGIEYNVNGRVMVADSLSRYGEIIDPFEGTYALSDVELVRNLGLGPFVVIDKLYGQYNIVSGGAVRAGVMKKYFGHEERAGLDERYFLKRSIVSDGLESLGFLDHDLTASYRHDFLNDRLRLVGAFSWSAADSLAYLQNYSAQYNVGLNTEFVLAGVVRHRADTPASFAAVLSLRHDAGFCVSEAELTAGARDTVKHGAVSGVRKAALAGARIQGQFPIDLNSKILRRVVPVAEAAVYTADIDSGHTDTQIRAGVTLGFAKNSAFQFRNNFGTVIRTAGGTSKVRRYRFDSEVLVVF